MGGDSPVPCRQLRLHVPPVALDVLGVALTPDEPPAVIDPVVPVPIAPDPVVAAVPVSVHHAPVGDMLPDHRPQGRARDVGDHEGPDVPGEPRQERVRGSTVRSVVNRRQAVL